MFRVTFTGNLGADPEQRYTEKGQPMVQFRTAVNTRRRNPAGEFEDRTDWVRVRVMGPRATYLADRLVKGSKVLVTGPLEVSEYESRQKPGQMVTAFDVFADDVELLSPTPKDDGATPVAAAAGRPNRGGTSMADGSDTATSIDHDPTDMPF